MVLEFPGSWLSGSLGPWSLVPDYWILLVNWRSRESVLSLAIDGPRRPHAALEFVNALEKARHCSIESRRSGDVRRDHDARIIPERRNHGERLDVEHVQRGT